LGFPKYGLPLTIAPKLIEILKNSSKFFMINKTEIVQISYNTGRFYDAKKDAKFYIDLRVATFF